MLKKIAGCVILYNPEKSDLENIKTYVSKVEQLYVFDNTEGKSNKDFFKNYENVQYFSDAENQGLPKRLNAACKIAINEGFDFLLTMDQDSSFDNKNIDLYFENVASFKEKEKVAVFGLEYNLNDLKKEIPNFIEIDHVITSAAIMNLSLFYEIGGFDENLFIDCVDIDYCYAELSKGLKTIKFTNLFFNHSLGETHRRGSVTSLYLFKKNVTIHSPLRLYYIYRNLLYLEAKHKNNLPEIVIKLKKNYKRHLKRSLKYSEKFFQACKYIVQAKRDFRTNKMGKIR